MKKPDIYSKEEFINHMDIDIKTVEKWEKERLLEPCGYYDTDEPYYSEKKFETGRKLRGLSELGFSIDDIKNIKKRTGFTNETENKARLFSEEKIAKNCRADIKSIQLWEEKGFFKPQEISEGKIKLYGPGTLETCRKIQDLINFGFTLEEIKKADFILLPPEEFKKELLNFSGEERDEILEDLEKDHSFLADRIYSLYKSLKSWKYITKKQRKIIGHLKKSRCKKIYH